MRVGILTFHGAHNFGAMLQAYALSRVIAKMGHEARLIDLCSAAVRRANHTIHWTPRVRQWARNVLLMPHARAWRTSHERFEYFKDRYLDLTEHFETPAQLRRSPPGFDAYVVGSDQVWNAENGLDPVWLLDFVRTGRKIAYAPSFGTAFVDPRYYGLFQRHLPTFHALSCRASRGIEIVREMTGLPAKHVADPTLLLSANEWSGVSAGLHPGQPYMLVYCMEESPDFVNLVPKAAALAALPVVVINRGSMTRFPKADRVVRDAGPLEFLDWVRNAALLCTNSFHGIVFAILFGRDFISVPHTTRNTRIESLLRMTDLMRHQIPAASALDDWKTEDFHIDYGPVSSALNRHIDTSLSFLREALA